MRFFYRRILEERVKKDIRALSKEELQEFFVSQGAPSFKGGQVYQWLWQKGVHDFELMTNLSLTHRNLLDAHFEIKHINIDFQQRSTDGTIKNAVKLHDNLVVESVLIPTSTRTTACVSSQVGCSLDCTFCATAALKRMRNLNADEIYDKIGLDPFDCLMLMGHVYMKLKQPNKARESYSCAARWRPNRPEGHLYIGISLQRRR